MYSYDIRLFASRIHRIVCVIFLILIKQIIKKYEFFLVDLSQIKKKIKNFINESLT